MNIRISRKMWVSIGITAALVALTLLVSTAMAQEPVDGVELSPAGGSYAEMMTYQGYLEDGGVPANGVYDFRINVWDAAVGGIQLGSTQVYDTIGITVEDGYFSFYFSPGTAYNVFNGGGRWLQLQVRPHGVGGYTTLPRQPITNVPYAWGLRPGAVISSTPTIWDDGWVFKVNMSGAYPVANAILGTNATGFAVTGKSPGGRGTYGYTEDGYGVYGYDGGTTQAKGYGGYFYSLNGVGVYGYSGAQSIANNAYAPGVYGRSNYGAGVYGLNMNSSPHAAGVRCESTDGPGIHGRSENDDGVYGYSSANSSGAGVYGYNEDWVGTYGEGEWGIVGKAIGTGHYGGYFYSDVYVQGKLDVGGAVDPIIAERFPADPEQDYESGDVLCLDEASPYVQPCTEENDTKVIGVAAPGPDIENGEILITIMGYQASQPQEGPVVTDSSPQRMVMVVKVDASYGPIQRGDLLTSSPTPGHAMKAEPVDIEGIQIYRPGTIIGKAMGSLSEGQGLIEVFVTLQ